MIATADILNKNQVAVAVELGYISIVASITVQVINTIRVDVDGFVETSRCQDIATAVGCYPIAKVIIMTATADISSKY